MTESLFRGPVLILDNEEIAARSLERYLTLVGIAAFVFTDPHLAISGYANLKASGITPQVAFLDGALGAELSGVDVAREIAKIDTDNQTALIAYTSYTGLFIGQLDSTARMDGALDKTDDIALLIEKIEDILKKRQLAAKSQLSADKP